MLTKIKKYIAFFQKIKIELKYFSEISNFFSVLNNLYTNKQTKMNRNKVIIEAYWDNPGYWFSITIILKSLSIDKNNCIAVISKDKNQNSRRLKLLGIKNIIVLENFFPKTDPLFDFSKIKNENDLLKIKLPFNCSTNLVYDELCRYQKSAYVNIYSKSFKSNYLNFLKVIYGSESIIKKYKPNYLITSHNIGIYYGSLCNSAIRNSCKVFTLNIEQNSLKYLQCKSNSLKHQYGSGPFKKDFYKLNDKKKNMLRKAGINYLQLRYKGQVDEVGAYFAYNKRKKLKISKAELKRENKWTDDFPIITIFSSNYIDFPRSQGWMSFLNFLDFNIKTIDYLIKKENIYVILKQHPANEFYPEIKNTDEKFFRDRFPSERFILADIEWDNKSLINISDGIITPHGTVGLEATHLKTPVLCENFGWYGHIGFVNAAKSKKNFFHFIDTKFWEVSEKQLKLNKKLCDEFIGWYFSNPTLSRQYKVPDTFHSFKNYKRMSKWISSNLQDIDLEVKYISKWSQSSTFSYHAWKIKNIKWS